MIALRLVACNVQEAVAPSDTLLPEPSGTPQEHARLLKLTNARRGAESVIIPSLIADYRPEPAA